MGNTHEGTRQGHLSRYRTILITSIPALRVGTNWGPNVMVVLPAITCRDVFIYGKIRATD